MYKLDSFWLGMSLSVCAYRLLWCNEHLYPLNQDPIKIDRYILFTKESGRHVVRPSSSLYVLIPAEIQRILRQRGLNLKKKPKEVNIFCSIVKENDGIKLLYTFQKIPLELVNNEQLTEVKE